MIDHVTLLVSDSTRARTQYAALLKALDYGLIVELTREKILTLPAPWMAGFGVKGKPDFWLRETHNPITPTHVAFRAVSRSHVDAFYKAALESGMKDNGAPGIRPDYHSHYYAAFVVDPDGNNLEAVCHEG